MKIIYEGKDITSYTEIHKADIIDNAGGLSDSIELWFADSKKLWSQWKPQKNDKVQIIYNGFDSGIMYIDELEQRRGLFTIRALSIPQEAKTGNSKAWENVRFLEFAGELAGKYGFAFESYGIKNHLYERVDQIEQTDFEFLAERCMLEGYMLKILDQKVIIYDERYMEGLDSVKHIYIEELDGRYKFLSKSTGIFSACRISYGDMRTEFKPQNGPVGPVLKLSNIFTVNKSEAGRYAKSLLRFNNKNENTGSCTIKLDVGISAGSNVNINGVGLSDGKYFCQKITHRLVDDKTSLDLRRPLEGY